MEWTASKADGYDNDTVVGELEDSPGLRGSGTGATRFSVQSHQSV
jgi:hypothetical protein